MRFALFVQEDPFFLPRYLPTLFELHKPEAVVVLSQKLPRDSMPKVISRYRNVFGWWGLLRVVFRAAYLKWIRGQSVARLVSKNNFLFIHAKNINSPDFVEVIRGMDLDIMVSIACPQIMGAELLQSAKRGAVNLHGGYLPDFPGVFTPFWNLLSGASTGGCTVHVVSEAIDGGPILARTTFPIEQNDSIFSVYEKISAEGIPLLSKTLSDLTVGREHAIPNEYKPENYHSFPTSQDRRSFVRKGLKVL